MEIFIGLMVVAVVGLIVGCIWDDCSAVDVWSDGVVVERHYVPEDSSVGVGPVIGGRGGVAITSHHTDEKHVLLIKDAYEVDPFVCEEDFYFKTKVGDKFRVKRLKKRFSGLSGIEAVE